MNNYFLSATWEDTHVLGLEGSFSSVFIDLASLLGPSCIQGSPFLLLAAHRGCHLDYSFSDSINISASEVQIPLSPELIWSLIISRSPEDHPSWLGHQVVSCLFEIILSRNVMVLSIEKGFCTTLFFHLVHQVTCTDLQYLLSITSFLLPLLGLWHHPGLQW